MYSQGTDESQTLRSSGMNLKIDSGEVQFAKFDKNSTGLESRTAPLSSSLNLTPLGLKRQPEHGKRD